MILEHIKTNWDCHLAAASSTGISILNGQAIAQSVIVGVLVFVVTQGLKFTVQEIKNKLKK
jgi:hypothetical protein